MALSRYAMGFCVSALLALTGCGGGGGHKGSQNNPPPSGSSPTPTPTPTPSPTPTPTPSPSQPGPAVSGLLKRPSNTTCVAPPRATGSVGVERAFPKLFF